MLRLGLFAWGWDYSHLYKKVVIFSQMLGGNGGPHFCRVRGEGIGVMRVIILHSIELELKRIFRGVKTRGAITQTFFIVLYFFSRFKNLYKI